MRCQELKKQETAQWDKNLRMGIKRLETREEVGKDRESTAEQQARGQNPSYRNCLGSPGKNYLKLNFNFTSC